ncbi:MAG: DNA translocase FtsK [Anaerovibrio sp.]|nr:DNA translocase FtsK [Anaerovibrio sp.]
MQKKRTRSAGVPKASASRRKAAGIRASETELKKDNSQRNYELLGLFFVSAGLISLCGLAGLNVGFVGLKFAKFLQYFFGIGAVAAAGALAAAGGYYIMRHQRLLFNARILGGAGFFVCSMALYHHIMVRAGEEILPESLVDGGGLLGGCAAILLHKVVGADGTPILLGAGMLGTMLVMTSWSLAQGILTTKEKAEKGADAAKKATAVVYDKTVEVGEKTKEQVQDYVQEHVGDVGDKLRKLRGKQFLKRYEQDSAFLLAAEEKAAAKDRQSIAPAAAVTEEFAATRAAAAGRSCAATAEELVEANPVAADFFGEKFCSDAEPEILPSLAAQLGLEEADAGSQTMGEAEASGLEAPEVSAGCMESEACSGRAAGEEAEYPAAGEMAEVLPVEVLPVWEGFDLADEIEPELVEDDTSGDAAGQEWIDMPEAESGCESEMAPQEIVQDAEYDYGIDDMEITYPESAQDITDDIDDAADAALEAADEITAAVGRAVASLEPAAPKVGAADEPPQGEGVPAPPPYILPPLQLLGKKARVMSDSLNQEIAANAKILGETLANFKVKASILNACHGPAVTRYEVKPAPGVKVSKITGLADDIALNMAASAVRIEQIPGRAAIGIEVPNRDLESVQLREVLENSAFEAAKSRLTVGLGKDISGQAIFADLAKMPHLLVAGATGSGKSVCINTLITSILFKAKPTEVKFILIDPKMVELSVYNDIPHLMVPVVTDSRKAASVLNWAVQEMEKRYGLIAQAGVRNMAGYNRLFADMPEKQLPSIVIIIDELADLMMVAPHDVEDAICRIAQKARAAGIYLVLATQRPSVNVITGVIKANIPSRISFAVTSQIDSRTILDAAGAEKLLGKGDMLFKPQEANKATRIQGAFVSDKEVELLVEYIKGQGHKLEANQEIIEFTNKASSGEDADDAGQGRDSKIKIDTLLRDAVELTMSSNNASASSFQRRYHIGYSRAGRLLDTMEQLGIVGPPQGSKPREILVTEAQAFEIMDNYEAGS